MEILKIKTEKRLIGDFGEKCAARLLKKKGYKILRRGYVANGHEIDLIAEKDGTVAFVEVKARTVGKEDPRESRPAAAVTPEKQRSIIAAAKHFLAGPGRDKSARMDVIEVYVNRDGKRMRLQDTVHMEYAFSLNTANPTRWRKD